MAHAVCRRPVKAETMVRYQVSPCEVCDRPSDPGTSFPPSISGFPRPYHSTNCSILTFVYMLFLEEGETGEVCEPSKKQCSFRNRGGLDT